MGLKRRLERMLFVYYSCDEHIELALDIVVDEEETAPQLEKLDGEKQLSTTCTFCTKPAIYKISG